MKVCSLIEKLPDVEDSQTSDSVPESEHYKCKQPESTDLQEMEHSQPRLTRSSVLAQNISSFCGNTRRSPDEISHPRVLEESHSLGSRNVPESVAVSLLGPGVRGFAMSSSMFEEALRLRAEQERTQQEVLKLEVVSKTRSILDFAVDNNIPPESLAFLRREEQADRSNLSFSQSRPSMQQSYSGELRAGAPSDSINRPFQRSPYLSVSTSEPPKHYENSNNASSVDPMNFRFGGVPLFDQRSPHNVVTRRPRSPAKLGTIAVASLANPITPYRPTNRTLPLHQRHYSMPADSMASARKPTERHYSRTRNQQALQATNSLRSPLGATSSMQVRPLPGQPLHTQNKRGQSISQDSITQHQQVIQFHHWISENPGETLTEKLENRRHNFASSQSLLPTIHKRHKPTDASTDVSTDMPQTDTMSDTPQGLSNPSFTELGNNKAHGSV